jgi:Protein of unknown function (DUF3572)
MNRMPHLYQLRKESVSCQEIVILAVAFLSSEEARLSRFLSLTGLNPADVPQLLSQKEFQIAILDHFAADEVLLLCFAEAQNIPPECINDALRSLQGPNRSC